MAIIVEEEKNNGNLTSWLGLILIFFIVVAAAYYLFFVTPAPAVITPPAGFADITPIAQVTFDPTTVLNNPTFQGLKQTIPEPTSTGPGAVGKPNPFTP
jgi:hypothetical protein